MTDHLGVVADGVAERLATRVRAQDRVDALDEAATGPTFAQRVADDPEALVALVEGAVDELLSVVADREARARLRALCAGAGDDPGDRLGGAGLAVASWTGGGVTVTEAGRAVAHALDLLEARAREGLQRRIADVHER